MIFQEKEKKKDRKGDKKKRRKGGKKRREERRYKSVYMIKKNYFIEQKLQDLLHSQDSSWCKYWAVQFHDLEEKIK